MSPNPPKVFVSYSHDSPRHSERVRALADRLRGDGVDTTIDQYDPHPREPWPRWMDRQIEEADFVLVVCTETYFRRAQGKEKPGTGHGVTFESVLIVQDLYDAGMWNEKFVPVLFDGSSSRFIPKPLRGYSHYRVDTDAGYEDLLRHLLNQPRVRKPAIGEPRVLSPAPGASSFRSMVPPLKGFIHRKEYDQVVGALCAENPHGSTVGITTALRGAGGFGKTALAQAVCHDERVQKKYPDGILLTTMGEEVSESGRLSRLRDLIRWWTESEPPVFERVDTASAFLRDRLAKRRVLLVVDDVWSELDLIPFQVMSSALLITTREKDILPSGSQKIDVDAMEIPEAVNLLRVGLPEWDLDPFNSLARRLGEWPLLLKLVNRQLRELVEKDGFTVGEALQEVESILESEGLTGFDRENAESRQSAVEKTLAVSLRRLSDSELARYRDLAVFPEDVEIPVFVLERFWGSSRVEIGKLCRRLDNLSLLLRFDRRKGIVQLHDVIRHYLVRREGENLPKLHRRFLETLRPQSGFWKDLPETETYLWRYLGYHLLEAGEREILRDLLLDFSFLRSKLQAADVNALLADYEPFAKEDQELRLVQGAIRLSAHAFSKDLNQLAPHLLGRLLDSKASGIRHLLRQCQSWRAPLWLRPRLPSLIAPGGSLLRTLEGHTAKVSAVAVVDGRRVVSASADRTLRVWDLETGQTLKILKGHTSGINAVAVVDVLRVVSASTNGRLRVWDLETGQKLKTLEGHTDSVRAVAVVDSHRIVSASDDSTLRVWDLEIGYTLKTLKGHTAGVYAVTVVDGRRAISASGDGTLRVWDLETGHTLKTLEGHWLDVRAVAVVDDRRAISASADGTLRVWDLKTGHTLKTFKGHSSGINAVAVVDGCCAVSASSDGTLRVWNLETEETLKTLEGHTYKVHSVAVVDGRRAVSASYDQTLRVWDLEINETLRTFRGHTDWVSAIAVADSSRVVSASFDETLRVWDLQIGQTLRTLEGHTFLVDAVAVVDGHRVISASADRTLRVWDLETGHTLKTLKGHTVGVSAVAVLDGRRAVSAAGRMLRVWDLETGHTLKTLKGHTAGVSAVAVMDSRHAVSASEDRTLRVWDLETGCTLKILKGHTSRVSTVAVVDGRRAVSASYDQTLHVWDLETGHILKTLEGHKDWVSAVAVVDGRRSVSASYDRTLRVWDLETGECLIVLNLDAEALSVAATPDGKTVVAGDSSGRVHFLDLVEAAEDQPPKGAAFE